ncbi:MAG TPA: amino acid adenylation domain-containing protein, partial [Thermoanaerobaculia bacterium]
MLRPQRDLSISPIFQVMVILQNGDIGAADQQLPRYPLDLESRFAKFDLTFELTETANGLAGSLKYATALYTPETIERMVAHFVALCHAIAEMPAAKIGDLDLIGEQEKQQLLLGFNETRADYPADKCIHDLFAEQVSLHSADIAVACGNESLTYQQLHERSRRVAIDLQSCGVQPDSIVGLCTERSVDSMVGLLAILEAGGAYLPLDSDYPDERLSYMLQDSGAAIVLTQEKFREKLTALAPAGTRVIALDAPAAEIGTRELRQQAGPRNLAYVIYTSGSTGMAKGVMVEHQSVVNLFFALESSVYGAAKAGGLRVSLNGPLTFDTSVKQLVQLLGGHSLEIIPEAVRRDGEALLQYVRERQIEVFDCTPSQLRLLLDAGLLSETPDLQLVLVGGEAIDNATWSTLAGSPIRFFNVYGPTECTVDATVCAIETNVAPALGRPIANVQVYVVDENDRPQPIGVPGELCIAGDGVARGYLNRPELTQQKFVANPFVPGTRMYRTGDLARWNADGTIQYLGRIDTQVKIRGFRVELGEIEARLTEHAAIHDCAVVAQGQYLVAFYRANDDVASDDLRAHLSRSLPEYMVPAAFVRLEAIPLTPNGKADRRALTRMDVAITTGRESIAPRNQTEREIAAIWAEVLKLAPETIGVHDNFFELGGHSLLATQLIAKTRSRMNADVPLKAVFERATVAQFAELIATEKNGRVPAIEPADRTQIERLPLSFVQERLWFIDQLEPGNASYNMPVAFTLRGAVNLDQLDGAFRTIIARHEPLRTVFPSVDGQARQSIVDSVDFQLERIDLTHYASIEAREKKAQEICATETATGFDLAAGPLFRGTVIRVAEEEHILLLNMHHIISDGWSLGVMLKELGAILDGAQLPALPIQYVDYSVWQRRWLGEGGALENQLAYWQNKLTGVPESLDLLTDYPRPSVQSFAGATHAFTLDPQLTAQLKSLSQ